MFNHRNLTIHSLDLYLAELKPSSGNTNLKGVTTIDYAAIDTLEKFFVSHFNLKYLITLSSDIMLWAYRIDSPILEFFNNAIHKSTITEQEKAFQHFFQDTHFLEIYEDAKDKPRVIKIMMILYWRCKNTEYFKANIPIIFLEFADFLAHELIKIPDILLTDIDLDAALEDCEYQAIPNHPSSYEDDITEGYWKENYVNQAVYQEAKARRANGPLSAHDLGYLRELVIRDENPNEKHRYPIPRSAPWSQLDKVVAILVALENIKPYRDNSYLLDILSLRVHDLALLKNTLGISMEILVFMGPSRKRLPFNNEKSNGITYSLELPDKTRIKWTPFLTAYIENYNIKPSREFLHRLTYVLQCCRKEFADAARRLSQYLDENPLVNRNDNLTSLRK